MFSMVANFRLVLKNPSDADLQHFNAQQQPLVFELAIFRVEAGVELLVNNSWALNFPVRRFLESQAIDIPDRYLREVFPRTLRFPIAKIKCLDAQMIPAQRASAEVQQFRLLYDVLPNPADTVWRYQTIWYALAAIIENCNFCNSQDLEVFWALVEQLMKEEQASAAISQKYSVNQEFIFNSIMRMSARGNSSIALLSRQWQEELLNLHKSYPQQDQPTKFLRILPNGVIPVDANPDLKPEQQKAKIVKQRAELLSVAGITVTPAMQTLMQGGIYGAGPTVSVKAYEAAIENAVRASLGPAYATPSRKPWFPWLSPSPAAAQPLPVPPSLFAADSPASSAAAAQAVLPAPPSPTTLARSPSEEAIYETSKTNDDFAYIMILIDLLVNATPLKLNDEENVYKLGGTRVELGLVRTTLNAEGEITLNTKALRLGLQTLLTIFLTSPKHSYSELTQSFIEQAMYGILADENRQSFRDAAVKAMQDLPQIFTKCEKISKHTKPETQQLICDLFNRTNERLVVPSTVIEQLNTNNLRGQLFKAFHKMPVGLRPMLEGIGIAISAPV